jgi:hypothetical protein
LLLFNRGAELEKRRVVFIDLHDLEENTVEGSGFLKSLAHKNTVIPVPEER